MRINEQDGLFGSIRAATPLVGPAVKNRLSAGPLLGAP
jgi:hypothetical protein